MATILLLPQLLLLTFLFLNHRDVNFTIAFVVPTSRPYCPSLISTTARSILLSSSQRSYYPHHHRCISSNHYTCLYSFIKDKSLSETNNNNDIFDESLVTTNTTDSYDTSSISSKGIVSSLTNIVNFVMEGISPNPSITRTTTTELSSSSSSPNSPQQLLQNIQHDYTNHNYLWTGKIHIPSFESNCTFTDPTLSFTGLDTFVRNTQDNLYPIVQFLTYNQVSNCCYSKLLDIQLNEKEGYIQTRWNMVGELKRLPWKPKVDVIGRTKFWYRMSTSSSSSSNEKEVEEENEVSSRGCYRVYLYDEEWEIEAWKALLQLVLPGK